MKQSTISQFTSQLQELTGNVSIAKLQGAFHMTFLMRKPDCHLDFSCIFDFRYALVIEDGKKYKLKPDIQ